MASRRRANRLSRDGSVSAPIDPDLDAADSSSAPARSSPFGHPRPPRWPRPRWDVQLVVFIGGCLGGWARYGVSSTWPTHSGRFPWATFDVNVAGTFILAL